METVKTLREWHLRAATDWASFLNCLLRVYSVEKLLAQKYKGIFTTTTALEMQFFKEVCSAKSNSRSH
jgi:hypothetical protein